MRKTREGAAAPAGRGAVLVAGIICLFTTACGTSGPADKTATAEPVNEAPGAPEVVLNAAEQQEAGIVVERVRIRSLPEVVRATGRITINENRTWRVGALTGGRVVKVLAQAGDTVQKGDVLARIFSHETHEARAAYRRAISELDRLKAALAYAQSVESRTKRLFELKAASEQQLEQARVELRTAEAAVANGEVELERTRSHLRDFLHVPVDISAEQEHRSANGADLIPVLSPANGTLLKRNITSGTVVEISEELFVITDLDTLWVMTAVAEEHLASLRIGMPATVRVQAYPGRGFEGSLTRLDTELDPTTRTISARVEVPNPRHLLMPEMYATVEMKLHNRREAIFIPEVAIQEVDAQNAVFVRAGAGRFVPRRVLTEPAAGGNVEIVEGLQPGEEVVVAGSFLLKSQLLKATLAEE